MADTLAHLAGRIAALERLLRGLSRTSRLANSSIENGSIAVYDDQGLLRGSVGLQPDGGVALVSDPANTQPPPTPTAPTVAAALAGLVISWDGRWVDASAAPTDFALVQVHVGTAADFTPDLTTQVATITAVLGGTVTVYIDGYDPVWVRLVAQNTAALTGAASAAVQGQPRQAVGQDLIDGIITDVKLAEEAVTEAKIAVNAVSTGKIQNQAITDLLLADDAVTAAKLATGAVDTAALADGAVLAQKLADNAVKVGKIDQDAVTNRELAANSVTAVELSAGSVTANAIAAGSVTTDKLTVVGGTNILNDPSFEGAYAAAVAAKASAYTVQDLTFGNGSPASLKFSTDGTAIWRAAELALLPCLPGDQVYIGVDYYASTDWVAVDGEINMQIRWEAEGGTILSYSKTSTRVTAPVLGAWDRLQAAYTAPAGAVRARIRVETGLVTAGTVWFDNAVCRPIVPGVQIADGAITTPKMIAGSIQGDRIAVNSMNADRIVSGSITTSQLNVTSAASMLQKFYDVGADATRWRIGGSSTTTATSPANVTSVSVPDAQAGGSVMRAVAQVASAWRPDMLIPFDPNVLYRVSAVVRQTVAGSDTTQQRFYAGVAGVAADGTTLVNTAGAAAASNQHYVAASSQNLTAGGGWVRFTGYLKGYAAAGVNGTGVMAGSPTAPGVLHANARYISPIFYVNYLNGTGTAEISSITIEVVETGAVQTVNIADGAITTPKMIAGSIQGDRIAVGTLNADRIVSGSIATGQLAALSVTAAQLAANSVTATAIAAGSIDATHIKAGAITGDRLSATAIDGKTITGADIRTGPDGQRVAMVPQTPVGFLDGEGNPRFYPGLVWYTGDASEVTPGVMVQLSVPGEFGGFPAVLIQTPDLGNGVAQISAQGGHPGGELPSVNLSAGNVSMGLSATSWGVTNSSDINLQMTANGLSINGAVVSLVQDWTTPALATGYSGNGNSNGTVQYRVLNLLGTKVAQWRGGLGVTYPSGAIANAGAPFAAALPTIVRPASRRTVTAAASLSGSTKPSVKIDFDTDGGVAIVGTTSTDQPSWISLNGVMYSL